MDTAAGSAAGDTRPPGVVRFAVFNTALSRSGAGELRGALATPGDAAAANIAEVLQRVRPDVVLLEEFDFDDTGASAEHFQQNYLGVSQHGAKPIAYPYTFAPRVNTGEPSGVDLNGDGKTGGTPDCFGWGDHPGHYGMLVLSRYPLDIENARSFRLLRWADFPGNTIPAGYYSDDALRVLRLSSKTHLDLPVLIPAARADAEADTAGVHADGGDAGGADADAGDGSGDGKVGREVADAAVARVHLLLSHPTPPVFDGPEDRNGRRNHDEVRFWVRYLDGELFTDDAGNNAALPHGAAFVVLGDLNADPFDGDHFGDAINRLVGHPRINHRKTPSSDGALQADAHDAGINTRHRGHPGYDTGDFADAPPRGPGNLRIDYALPSANLRLLDAGVFWPTPDSPLARLAGASDHHLVWVDLSASP